MPGAWKKLTQVDFQSINHPYQKPYLARNNSSDTVMDEPKEDQILDCTGLNCPLPILKTKKAMDIMKRGKILKMISTDPDSINDVMAWTKKTGNELVKNFSGKSEYVFYIKKT